MAYDFVFSALAYKEIEYEYRGVHLVKDGGQQVCTLCTLLVFS